MKRSGPGGRFSQISWAEPVVFGVLVCSLAGGGMLLWHTGREPAAEARAARPEPSLFAQTVSRLSAAEDEPLQVEGDVTLEGEAGEPLVADQNATVSAKPPEPEPEPEEPTAVPPEPTLVPGGDAEPPRRSPLEPDAGVEPPLHPDAGIVDDGEKQPVEPRESCGLISCSAGFVCCNPSCGTCVLEGESCDPKPCVPPVAYPVSEMCGTATCDVGEVCCNPSCGTCVPAGQSCDETPCTPRITYSVSEMCGTATCNVGEVCCNPSCGTCVPAGQSCDQTPCAPRIVYPL